MTTERPWSRRRFLKTGLLGGIALGLAGTFRFATSGYDVPADVAEKLRVLSPMEYRIAEAIAFRMCRPDAPDAPMPEDLSVGLAIDDYLAGMPAWFTDEVRLLLLALEASPLAVMGTSGRFTRLSPDEQDACVKGWAESRLEAFRQGFQGCKALAMMAYYRHPRTFPVAGYLGPE